MAGSSRTVVEHLPYHPKGRCLSAAPAIVMWRKEVAKRSVLVQFGEITRPILD